MDYSQMSLALLFIPLASTILLAVLPAKHTSRHVYETIHILALLAVLVLALQIIGHVIFSGTAVDSLDGWMHIDALGCVFIGLIGIIGFLTGFYSLPYVANDVRIKHMRPGQVKAYYAFFDLFVFTMLLAAMSNNIIMMWIAIEATTLSTVFLVGIYNDKLCLEAAWKYVIVCTAGVAFGLYGTLLVYADAANVMADPTQAAFFTSILPVAQQLDPTLMGLSFVFVSIGFGTKAGLFPMHTWLPDAHSQAPSPVSGLLSGVLLKCALLIIIRFYIIAIQATGPEFPQMVMLILGICSVVVAAFSVYSQDDLKRKLAYHSCENVGIVALCLGFGGPIGIAAALLHCVFHALTKSMLFCISGNVLMKYGTRDINKIHGMLYTMPVTAVVLAIGFFALAGFPPFAMFVSEISAFAAGLMAGDLWIVIILAIALAVVVCACAHVVTVTLMGKAPANMKKGDVSALALAPEIVLCFMLLWFGVATPKPLVSDVEQATAIVMQQNDTNALHQTPVVKEIFDGSHATNITLD